jgi:hypothetical protein
MFSYRHSKLGIEVLTGQSVQSLFKKDLENRNTKRNYLVEKLILLKQPQNMEMMQTYGHAIVSPVPSLFTFNIKDPA